MMNRRSFLMRSFMAAAAAGISSTLDRRGLVRTAKAGGNGPTPYPVLAILVRGGLDPAMHLVATPNGSFGNVTIANRMTGTTGIQTTASGIRYFTGSVTPTGKTDFAPYLPDVSLLRAFKAGGDHGHIAAAWLGDNGTYNFSKTSWGAYLAAQNRAAGAIVPKPCAIAYPTMDFSEEPYLDYVAYAPNSPNPATAPERILSINGFFQSVSSTGLPPFARQAPAYGLVHALDGRTYQAATQPVVTSAFAAANANADGVLQSVYGAPAWPPTASVYGALGLSATAAVPDPTGAFGAPYAYMFALAYEAFAKNLSHVIAFQNNGMGTGSGWDSHYTNYAGQIAAGNTLWPALGKLVTLMKATPSPLVAGKTLYDTTNIWIQSEMGRTPGADVAAGGTNSSDGTGHWPYACATFLGGRFKRGAAIGGFAPDWTAMPVNPSTGAATGGSVLAMNNVIATVLKAAGVDPTGYTSAAPIDALLDMTL
jgi:hypothetical protein